MATQAQVDSFNAAIASGNFGLAADIAAGAGYGAADVEAYIEANAGNLGFDPGIDIPSDVVASYFDAPPVSYGPPSPAVSPAVSNSISLTPAGIASLAPSANVSSPANVFSPADYGPPSPIFDPAPAPVDPNVEKFNSLIREGLFGEAGVLATEAGFTPEQVLPYLNDPNIFPEFGGNVTLDTVKSFVPKPPAPPPAAVDPVAQDLLGRFDRYMDAASSAYGTGAADFMFSGAANVVNEAAGKYGDNVYGIVANYLNTDPRFAGLREQIGIGQKDTPAFDADNVRSFVESQIATEATPVTSVTPEDEAAVPTAQTTEDEAAPPTAQTTPGPGQIYGIPRFERQTQSDLTFAPLRRGLAQLRTETYSPGLTSGQRALVGSGFTPAQLRKATQDLLEKSAGKTPEQIQADFAYLMDIGGVSPAERSNVLGQSTKVIQDAYNQARPSGIFATPTPAPAPQPFALPEDFALQTGAYGAPTPTFFTPDPAKTTSPSESSSANANQPGSIDGGGGEVGFDQNASSFGGGSNSFGMSASELGNAIAQGVDAFGLTSVFAPSLVSEEDAAPIETASFSPGQGLGSGYLSVDDSNAAADAAAEAAGNAAIASMADTAGFGGTGDDG
jgi:hypothetical protein